MWPCQWICPVPVLWHLVPHLFLHTRQTAPLYDRVLLALGGIFAILAAAPLALPYQWWRCWVSCRGFHFCHHHLHCPVWPARRQPQRRALVLLAWSLLLAGTLVMGARNLGWLPTNMLTTHAIQIGSAFWKCCCCRFALADRIHLAREEEKKKAQVKPCKPKNPWSALRQSHQLLEPGVIERTRNWPKPMPACASARRG